MTFDEFWKILEDKNDFKREVTMPVERFRLALQQAYEQGKIHQGKVKVPFFGAL